ncbi:hypothetical protein, partial [Corynebacterium lipophilum]|uniref:hypothetical protein n=2 Tax=Corynebacterium lipophilum TaxID=2804918 RepID=UPI0020954020
SYMATASRLNCSEYVFRGIRVGYLSPTLCCRFQRCLPNGGQVRAAVYTGATTPVPVVLDAEAIISLVHQYVAAPHGTKQALLDKHGIVKDTMRRWIDKVANGTIAHYTHTRKAEPLNTPKTTNNDMVTMSRKEYNALQRENAKLRKENKLWKDTSDVLGKAIASLPENTGGDSNAAGKSSQ